MCSTLLFFIKTISTNLTKPNQCLLWTWQVDKILVQLFLLHKQNMAARGSIQFLHVSKSGGTNLCMTAEANGCSSEVRYHSVCCCALAMKLHG